MPVGAAACSLTFAAKSVSPKGGVLAAFRAHDPDPDNEIPGLLCELCRQFYELGWVSGTGGGISIRGADGIYMAPSGVQKERIRPEDMFVLDASELDELRGAARARPTPRCGSSECQPLFYQRVPRARRRCGDPQPLAVAGARRHASRCRAGAGVLRLDG